MKYFTNKAIHPKHINMWTTLMDFVVCGEYVYLWMYRWVCICVTIIIIEDIMNLRWTWSDMRGLSDGRGKGKKWNISIYEILRILISKIRDFTMVVKDRNRHLPYHV